MNFEELQKCWQAQEPIQTISVDADVLLKEVHRNEQQLRATIFFRDLREVGVAGALIPVFIYLGWTSQNWTNYLVAAACLFVGSFILVGRRRRGKVAPEAASTLKACVASSLNEVRYQIWLLKNVLWWYLLPIGLSVAFSIWWPIMRSGTSAGEALLLVLGTLAIIAPVNCFLYWLNHYAMRKNLLPREEELKRLLSELEPKDDSTVSTPEPL
jgi:hypothetical protein